MLSQPKYSSVGDVEIRSTRSSDTAVMAQPKKTSPQLLIRQTEETGDEAEAANMHATQMECFKNDLIGIAIILP